MFEKDLYASKYRLERRERADQSSPPAGESKDTTLNAEFRRWLQQYVEAPQTLDDLASLMGRVNYARPGKAFTRDERNER